MWVLSNVGKLYDGASCKKSSLRSRVDLFVENGLVKELKPHNPKLKLGPAHAIIDASGYTVTPGLFDCHSHITALGLSEKAMDIMNSQTALLFMEKILHKTLVDGGVTTARDIGGATHFLKRMVDEGMMIGPRLKVAICMLSTTGGHADFRGPDRCHSDISRLWPAAPGRPSSIVDGPDECRKRVREIAACGADLIKICASPGVASPSDKLEHRDFSNEEIAAITSEATARGLRVAAHAHSKTGIRMAIDNGVHDIQHISYMDRELVERAYKKGCTVTPTSWIVSHLQTRKELSAFVQEKVKQVTEVHAKAVAHARSGGLKILSGTDPVFADMHGRNFMELVYLMQDGLTALEAWHSATGLAAAEIGQADAGVLAPGRRADLLVSRGDTISDPALLGKGGLLEVVKDGVGCRGFLKGIPQRTYRSAADAVLAKDY
ncbi:MAG TPA: amidohydrolase family protein [Elusimicrobiota bacterium]|jgi:imidazolonepropionase-like amidohydrolase|nr:amidohydrolase family protein [Elusimicrobiota bacterium]